MNPAAGSQSAAPWESSAVLEMNRSVSSANFSATLEVIGLAHVERMSKGSAANRWADKPTVAMTRCVDDAINAQTADGEMCRL
jgi:hypothetical protein